ncbi:hypothetical protein Taro_003571 [Colocasia esculenta]|uniref:Uncharacterized protein n=1 Tax=Colocasia esculenta TaxID=4460 RepID=A0A843TJQ4_COLES|nr:hypothetical protein [Colocasia esculenta]
MPITDPSHTFHSASSSGHHITEEYVIEEDEEDEIDSQDDIDDNENMDEGDDESLFDIARVNNTKIEYEEDPPDIFTSDQWIDEAMLNNSHEGIDVPCTLEGEEPHVQQTDSSTLDTGPSEPCAGSSQQPGDAGLSQFSPNVMTFSQHGLYDIGASQILTDEVMPDEITHSQPPQSTVEDMDSETAQSESCDAILVHETQSQSETEVDAQSEIQEQRHSRGRGRGRASRKGKKRWFP